MSDDAASRDRDAAKAILDLFRDWLTRVESKIDTLNVRLEGKADRAEVAGLEARVDQKADKTALAEIRQQLELKADKTDLADLDHTVDTNQKRLDAVDRDLEHRTRTSTERKEWKQYVLPLMISLALLVVGVIQVVK